jgi:hypothetical protein
MANLFGRSWTRRELLACVGDLSHDAFDYIEDSNGELGACLDEVGLPLAEVIPSLEMSADD